MLRKNIIYIGVWLICLLPFYKYILGSSYYIFLTNDSLIFYWPYKQYIFSLYGNNIPLYSFTIGLGQNIYSIKSFLFDPFNILYVISPKNLLPIFFYQYIIKSFIIFFLAYKVFIYRGLSRNISYILSICFVFSGMFVYFWGRTDINYTALVFIVVQWFGYENFRVYKNKVVFICCNLPLLVCCSVYWFIVAVIFMALYILVDLLQENNIIGYFKSLREICLIYLLSLMISVFSWLPELYVIIHNTRVSSSINFLDNYNLHNYVQFFSRGLGEFLFSPIKVFALRDSGPRWYSSITIILFSIVYLRSEFSKIKTKVSIILVVLGVLFLPFITAIFNGFSDLSYRWSWMIMFPLFISAGLAINKNNENKISVKFSIILLCIVAFLFIANYYLGDIILNDIRVDNIYFQYLFLILSLLLLICKRFNLRYIFMTMMLSSCLNIIFALNYLPPLDKDIYFSKDKIYFNSSYKAINIIKASDHSFYRLDKTYYDLTSICQTNRVCGLNENVIQGYNGVKSYLSSPNPYEKKFALDMDTDTAYNWIFGFDGRNDVLRMLGVKYILSKSESSISGYSYQQKVDDINIYLANNYQGIGHVFHNYITYDNFMSLSTTDKDLAFSRCTILNNQQISAVKVEPVTIANCLARDSVLSNNSESFNLEVLNGRHVLGSVNLLSNGILYLAIPYDQGFSAKVDGKDVPVLNVSDGFVGLELTAGKHSIELYYFPPLLKIGLIISGFTLLVLIIYGSIKITIRIKKKDE